MKEKLLGLALRCVAMIARYVTSLMVQPPCIDDKERCPACGIVLQHDVTFDATEKVIAHTCARCRYRWGQTPVNPVEVKEVEVAAVQKPNGKIVQEVVAK